VVVGHEKITKRQTSKEGGRKKTLEHLHEEAGGSKLGSNGALGSHSRKGDDRVCRKAGKEKGGIPPRRDSADMSVVGRGEKKNNNTY